MAHSFPTSRRGFLVGGGLGLGGAMAGALPALGAAGTAESGVDTGAATGDAVTFPPIHADTERPDGPPPKLDPPSRRVGFAIMGLGRLALENILPAFAECKHAKPVALVSGSPAKLRAIASQYGMAESACYSYESFSKIKNNPAVEVVYVVLPNGLHKDAVIRAAAAGKHVLCEKPMANTAGEAREMVAACRDAQRRLMIAYRCQYEVNNKELAQRVRSGELGQVQLIDALNVQNQGTPGQWRQKKDLAGGGSLPDVGLYCLNTIRALLGEEPIEIAASIHSPAGDPRFSEVESTVSFSLRFPSGVIANCASSYSAHKHQNLRVLGAAGVGEIENAFAYEGQRLRIIRRAGHAEANTELALGKKNQFALEMDHMAHCVRTNTQPRTPGEEGLQDQILMEAIYRAAQTGERVRLDAVVGLDTFRGAQPEAD